MAPDGRMTALLLDTHVLAWIGADDRRLSAPARGAIVDGGSALCASAVTAWEYADLVGRGRLPRNAPLAPLMAQLDLRVLPLPQDLWQRAAQLPDIHRDPIDRMLIAHTMALDATLITADATVRSYPGLRTLW
jgi:PIN domain nuclease of toxin-antitoxin system